MTPTSPAAPTFPLNDLKREQLLALLAETLARLITPAPALPTALLSPEDLSKRWSVPESWIREQWRAGRLHGQRLGRYVRFSEGDAEAFLASDHAKGLTAPVRLIHPRRAAIHAG